MVVPCVRAAALLIATAFLKNAKNVKNAKSARIYFSQYISLERKVSIYACFFETQKAGQHICSRKTAYMQSCFFDSIYAVFTNVNLDLT